MGRTIRVNFKSGVLPRPRQVVPKILTKKEQSELQKTPQKFEDGMAPRGSSANPPPRLPKTAQQKIDLSARAPQEREPRSDIDMWRRHIADVRRTYLESTLRAYEQREQHKMESREASEARKEAAVEASDSSSSTTSESLATLLTTPTIESSLTQEFVVKRTPEEQQELQLKRRHNRELTEERVLEAQYSKLIELYQQSAQFISTEEQLEDRINVAFKPSQPAFHSSHPSENLTPEWFKYVNAYGTNNNDGLQKKRAEELTHALEGSIPVRVSAKVRAMPGLKRIRAMGATETDKTSS